MLRSARLRSFFKLNYLLLLKRECTALEKGDVITYLTSIEGVSKGDLINFAGIRSAASTTTSAPTPFWRTPCPSAE